MLALKRSPEERKDKQDVWFSESVGWDYGFRMGDSVPENDTQQSMKYELD